MLFFSFIGLAQTVPLFGIKLKFSVQQGGLENSLITITRDGKPYRIIDPSKGKYFIDFAIKEKMIAENKLQEYLDWETNISFAKT